MKPIPFELSPEMEKQNGEFIYLKLPCDFVSVNDLQEDGLTALPFCLMVGNPFDSLVKLGLISEEEKTKLVTSTLYDDVNMKRFYGAVPTAIVSEDITEYIGKIQFTQKLPQGEDFEKIVLNPTEEIMLKMGPGYSHGYSEDDGLMELVNVKTRLENGDWLCWKTWQWFNK